MERKTNHGIPCSPESLAEWEKAFTDIEESIEHCEKHPCKLNNGKV